MKYFIDTEFIEGFHKPLFGKRRHFIDLISIGIYAEDGQTYYAISNEFNPKNADAWVKENVISKLPLKHFSQFDSPNQRQQAMLWKSNGQIAEEIKQFIYKTSGIHNPHTIGNWDDVKHLFPIDFYAYYADYDWVVFCSLFGRMIDLPKGFPMYCRDLKQTLNVMCVQLKETPESIKELNGYPKQMNEHNALADAKWNYELYKFLTQ